MSWVPEKMREGKCSTDLSQLDQGVEPLSPYGDTSFPWWAYCKVDYVHAGFEQE